MAFFPLTASVPLGSRRSLRIVERNVIFYRRIWPILVSGFFEPLFYLLSLGIGLNTLVGSLNLNGTVVDYATFVAPGMMATAGMTGAIIDSLYNTFWKLKVSHTYDHILATPISIGDIALGEVLWAVVRGSLYAGSFLICMFALGDVASWWGVLCFPAAVLTCFAFACVGLAACTWLRSWQDFDTVALIQMPIFLFSATFFPITLYPGWLQAIVRCSPLYHSAALLRDFSLGQLSWNVAGHVLYLVVMSLVGLTIAARRFARILTP
jgi:lipooligosaccharide transport system permease protein